MNTPASLAYSPTQQADTTESALAITRGHDLRSQAGRLTLMQVVELCDAMSCVRTVCHHVFARNGHEMPERYRAQIDALGIGLSVARARAVLALWHKWTHPLGTSLCACDSAQALSYVQGFIWALRDPMYAPVARTDA